MNPNAEPISRPVARMLQAVTLFAAGLLLITWNLWIFDPETSVQIPWWEFLCGTPRWVDVAALATLVIGLVLMGWRGAPVRTTRVALALFTVGLLGLVALDQHRLQPWVCQFILLGMLFLLAPNRLGMDCWKIVVASIYIWSAISKIDAAFFTSHGQLLLAGLLKPLGVHFEFWSTQTKMLLVSMFPLGEFLVGILLLFRRTRRYGLPASLMMHGLLLWTLGVGLQHEWGVLIWNLFFIAQNVILFGPEFRSGKISTAHEQMSSPPFQNGTVRNATIALAAFASIYPVLEIFGYCDHWPAWAVYSSRPAQVKIFLEEDAADELPEELQPFLGTPAPLEDRVPFNLDAWSFAHYKCPIYPQLRYRLAMVQGLFAQQMSPEAVTVEVALTPDRWTGERQRFELRGMDEVREYCTRFWFNTKRR